MGPKDRIEGMDPLQWLDNVGDEELKRQFVLVKDLNCELLIEPLPLPQLLLS